MYTSTRWTDFNLQSRSTNNGLSNYRMRRASKTVLHSDENGDGKYGIKNRKKFYSNALTSALTYWLLCLKPAILIFLAYIAGSVLLMHEVIVDKQVNIDSPFHPDCTQTQKTNSTSLTQNKHYLLLVPCLTQNVISTVPLLSPVHVKKALSNGDVCLSVCMSSVAHYAKLVRKLPIQST